LLIFELDDGHIKVNPLMGWNKAQIGTYLSTYGLPELPKIKEGYQ
jgi:phosphoadenosine phosphosulfate reductase